MKLKEIMSQNVSVIRPDSTLAEAARKMAEVDTGILPVCDGDRIQGMITDRDITVRAVAKGLDPNKCNVRDAMTSDVVYIYDDQDVQEAARIMEERQIRRLVVLDHNKKLCGIVSLGDLALHLRDSDLSGEVLERVSEPTGQARR